MPLLIVTPEEITERLNKFPNIPQIIKNYSIKENSFRVEMKIDKIPMDIKINLKFDSYSAGMIFFSYSCNIPKIFFNMLKGVIKDRTKEIISIEDDFIKMNADQLILNTKIGFQIKNINFEHGFYKIDFSL
ncbi:hypothetical protein JEZ13_06015 [bacterium]|nr:hypothetical protein [bacterium]